MEKVNISLSSDIQTMKLWDKGYSVHKEIEAFTIGKDLEFDVFLAPFDILGSIAHAIMLKQKDFLPVLNSHLLSLYYMNYIIS